jgi:hypothetical protein
MTKPIKSEHRIWDRDAQRFIASDVGTRPALRGRFLKGPVPWSWIVTAAELPGSALVVGLCLWRLAGATKRQSFMLGNDEMEVMGVDRAAKSRALSALEQAGLISVAREPGRLPTVTLLADDLRPGSKQQLRPRAKSPTDAFAGTRRKPRRIRAPRG